MLSYEHDYNINLKAFVDYGYILLNFIKKPKVGLNGTLHAKITMPDI